MSVSRPNQSDLNEARECMVLDAVATGYRLYIKEGTDKEAVEGFCQRGTMSVLSCAAREKQKVYK